MSVTRAERPCSVVGENSEELDEDFLEVLGSFEADEDQWYGIFWSTIEDFSNEYNESYAMENIQNEHE